jgi:hypothetical protein
MKLNHSQKSLPPIAIPKMMTTMATREPCAILSNQWQSVPQVEDVSGRRQFFFIGVDEMKELMSFGDNWH